MSLGANRKTHFLGLLVNLLTVLGTILLVANEALAAAPLPIFQVKGGDVASGGRFNYRVNGYSNSCQGSYYQAPDYSANPVPYKRGGILAWAANRTGSHSDYAALSLGLIEKGVGSVTVGAVPQAVSYGFYTGNDTTKTNSLSFANFFNSGAPNNFDGGIFEGLNSRASDDRHCIPDYYDNYVGGATNLNGATTINLGTCNSSCSASEYQDVVASGTTVTMNNGGAAYSVAPGTNRTFYVTGNLYINKNITYQGGYTDANIPRLAVVVIGNIFVDPSVTQLDGIYIAQPDMTTSTTATSTGELWTCHDSSNNVNLSSLLHYMFLNCRANPAITFNGSVVAAQVQLTRISGDVTGTPAETFNYPPEAAIGGSFTGPGSGGGGPP